MLGANPVPLFDEKTHVVDPSPPKNRQSQKETHLPTIIFQGLFCCLKDAGPTKETF